MRKITHIALAAALAAMCVLPAAGQSYKASKVREKSEPEPLTFSRVISSRMQLNSNLRETTRGWDIKSCGVETVTYWNTFGDNYMLYTGHSHSLTANKEEYNLLVWFKLFYRDSHELELFAYEITAFGKRHPVMNLSSSDDKLNRTWLWRIMHNKETVELQREAAEEYFNKVADSLEDFLRNGPKSESQLLD